MVGKRPRAGISDLPSQHGRRSRGPLPRLRRVVAFTSVIGALLVLTASPAAAAKPLKITFDLADPVGDAQMSAALSDYCGTPIQAVSGGTLTIHAVAAADGTFRHEIDKWQIRDSFTNLETQVTLLMHDVGPDHYWIDKDGHLFVAVIGRSLTGTGVIGRVVIDAETGEIVSQAGRDLGPFFDQVCDALT
jgi:hypothetical protein